MTARWPRNRRKERALGSRAPLSWAAAILFCAAGASLAPACDDEAPRSPAPVSYASEVSTLLRARCQRCHDAAIANAGYRTDSYARAIGCTTAGRAAPGADGAIFAALARPDHATLLSPEERHTLERWALEGTPSTRGGVHSPRFADPRAPENHARWLRARRYAPITNLADPDACATCHDGVGAKPEGVRSAAPGATSCTTCHAEERGVFDCTTCHGGTTRDAFPSDRCFHPEETRKDAHLAHVRESASRAEPIACATCHPVPNARDLGGVHANGSIEVWFTGSAGAAPKYDAERSSCEGTCHSRGGARSRIGWNGTSVGCRDCHASPPPSHRERYRGACSTCHREANGDGTSLDAPRLHLNGKVDLGDGSGRCGACHGTGDDPWPTTGAHPAHRLPANARAIECTTCHAIPANDHPSGRGGAVVALGGLARKGGARATYDAATKTCSGTYCHAGNAGSTPAPRWTDPKTTCASCHGAPPPPPHSQIATCGQAGCHRVANDTHVDGFATRDAP